mmetsp:Transcript_11093/g.20935  ORF Transcript_11093/g.20935 Transcript_11093/m.20935 type:complete len:413 (+) Transcript_11093:129-1367(+)
MHATVRTWLMQYAHPESSVSSNKLWRNCALRMTTRFARHSPGGARVNAPIQSRTEPSKCLSKRIALTRERRSIIACPQSKLFSSLNYQNDTTIPHVPVLLNEILDFYQNLSMQVYVDGTLGAGGHAMAILSQHKEMKTLIGFDVDPYALEIAGGNLRNSAPPGLNLHLERSNFRELVARLQALSPGLERGGVDAILLDLGVSSMQVDNPNRGFSFMSDGPVDMRMDPTAGLKAEQVVNDWPEMELGRIIRDYGEDREWRAIASRIVQARPIKSNAELVACIGRGRRPSNRAAKQIHPATRTFQAIRIAVNDELAVISEVLPAAIDCLAPGGRLGVISFHSLEDRIVKQAFRVAAGKSRSGDDIVSHRYLGPAPPQPEAIVKILTKKPVVATQAEVAGNPRSRSAKLRVIEKL